MSLLALLAVVSFAAGAVTDYLWGNRSRLFVREPREIRQAGRRFTNPLLECDIGESLLGKSDFDPFEQLVRDLIEARMQSGDVDNIAFYFRNLNDGPWFGINEYECFTPGSILKLPLLIGYFRYSQIDPGIMRQTLRYTGATDLSTLQVFRPRETLVAGREYTVADLLERMIIYSDNNAMTLLNDFTPPETLDRVLNELNLKLSLRGGDCVSVVSLTSFLRILFNASYLGLDKSESVLEILSRSEFSQGIRAGVPPGVVVASKFGEAGITNTGGEDTLQLHEIGIVYAPDRPYLVGILTKGSNYKAMAATIRDISQLVYAEVTRPQSPPGP